tara:strand:+ start:874 stop:1224 length:351 start_codon:yes stop_codon:yes gene_type:complete
MGLDILLIKIIKESSVSTDWLPLVENPELRKAYSGFLSQREVDSETESGFHYEVLTSQRKGVNKAFYLKYPPDAFIFTKKGLEDLKKHVLADRLKDFEKDFLEKFIEGENVIIMSF